MTNLKEIPNLIKLLDDESPQVRKTVFFELASFGPILKNEIKKLSFPLSSSQMTYLQEIFRGQKVIWLKQKWPTWFGIDNNFEKLECALTILSAYLSGFNSTDHIQKFLDEMCMMYKREYMSNDELKLAQFLFREMSFVGNEQDYYNPQNSNLFYVIKNKKGIPISLVSLYMLIGHRLGLKIEGCNFPGHFLARINMQGRRAFVDCYSNGQLVEEDDLEDMSDETMRGIEEILEEKVEVEFIIRRYLANLIRAFQIRDDERNFNLMVELFTDLDDKLAQIHMANISPEDIICDERPFLKPGERICHKRYGYRGLIVEADTYCQATDDWYYSNQSQPNRNQPWFHVLVHDSEQVTYVAESNLVLDHNQERIQHPLVSYFFKKKGGRYIRNDNPWPDTEF